jgi:hypothetical protein
VEVERPGFNGAFEMKGGKPSTVRMLSSRWWPALCKVLVYGAGFPREARRSGRAGGIIICTGRSGFGCWSSKNSDGVGPIGSLLDADFLSLRFFLRV